MKNIKIADKHKKNITNQNSYSEEEVIDLLKALQIYFGINKERVDIDKWFLQFKKE